MYENFFGDNLKSKYTLNKLYRYMYLDCMHRLHRILHICNSKACLWPQHPFFPTSAAHFCLLAGGRALQLGVFKVKWMWVISQSRKVLLLLMIEWSSTLAVPPSVSRTFASFPLFFMYMYVPFNSSRPSSLRIRGVHYPYFLSANVVMNITRSHFFWERGSLHFYLIHLLVLSFCMIKDSKIWYQAYHLQFILKMYWICSCHSLLIVFCLFLSYTLIYKLHN